MGLPSLKGRTMAIGSSHYTDKLTCARVSIDATTSAPQTSTSYLSYRKHCEKMRECSDFRKSATTEVQTHWRIVGMNCKTPEISVAWDILSISNVVVRSVLDHSVSLLSCMVAQLSYLSCSLGASSVVALGVSSDCVSSESSWKCSHRDTRIVYRSQYNIHTSVCLRCTDAR